MKLSYDVEYVNNITLFGDMKIIIQTVLKVFKRADIQFENNSQSVGFIAQRQERMKSQTAGSEEIETV